MTWRSKIACAVLVLVMPAGAMAVTLPGAADSSRIQVRPPSSNLALQPVTTKFPIRVMDSQSPPPGAKSIQFQLKKVILEGDQTLDPDQLKSLYQPFIGHTVTLDVAWVLAAQITEKYKEAGYFLSRAYVPAQTLDNGTLKIKIVEGFVEDVILSGEGANLPLVRAWIARIKACRPIRADQLEQALLELNTLPDVTFRAVLIPPKNKNGVDGGTFLQLTGMHKNGHGSLRFDNHGSRYLGPYQIGANYEMALMPGQKTSVSFLGSTPSNELKGVSLQHTIMVAPQVMVDASGGYTTATPGYLLKVQEVESKAVTLGVGVTYQWLRQRSANFSTRLGVDTGNTNTDILNTPLSRDRLRMIRLNAAYNKSDRWNGYNTLSATFTKGLAGFGASKVGELNLSRAEAKPDFRKLEFNGARLQGLGAGFQVLLSTAGQVASGPLYSSEEFGYGGQSFGRAYDNSEIVGDHGLSGALELRYTDLKPLIGVSAMPYGFFDGGIVWNDDIGQKAEESGTSAGFGLQAHTGFGADANMGFAFPLSREAASPIYSKNGEAARFYFDLTYTF